MLKNERVSIAVVGIRASGKSYLLSDMITSFGNLGYTRYDIRSEEYASIGKYRAKITSDGKMDQTEFYACRPGENIYGATYKGNGKKIDVDFVDIPGEVFDEKNDVGGNTYLQVFTQYRDALLRKTEKLFTVSVWENAAGFRKLIVEPVPESLSESRKEEYEREKQSNVVFDSEQFKKSRAASFQGWGYVFSWLKANGFKERTTWKERTFGKTKISGKELLKNFLSYQPDSLMCALAEQVERVCLGLNITRTDFLNGHCREAFYFLYYCSRATDIVVCDRLFVPGSQGECNLDTDDNYLKYASIISELNSFIKENKTNVYLAFRGVDYMLKAKEEEYKKLIGNLRKKDKYTPDRIRNAVYSAFAYLLWNHVDDSNCAEDDEKFRQLVNISNESFNKDKAAKLFIDLTCNSDNDKINLRHIIPQHIGTGPGNAFRHLLDTSYGYKEANPDEPMQTMPPHTYFTCTPVTEKFEVYVNDPQSDNRRFIYPEDGRIGPAKYFDTAGSHFCFGTYQLCLDILCQHDCDVVGWSKFGDLINTSISRR